MSEPVTAAPSAAVQRAVSALRRRGGTHFAAEAWEDALAAYAEIVRLDPGDHQARFRAARCLVQLGEQERALTAYHAAAEGLLKKDYLLSAMAACKEALRINPVERRVKDTLRRIHARAEAEVGRTPVPPPLPPEPLEDEGDLWSALTDLRGEELVEKAMEVLGRPQDEAAVGEAVRPPLPLFAELDREAFVDVVLRMGLADHAPGDVLIEQGAKGDAIYVLTAGGARVVRHDEDGRETELARLPGGTLVGEMALLTDAPRSASVVVDRPSEVFVLSRRDVEELSRDHAAIPTQLVQFCRKRLLANLVNTSPLFAPFDPAARLEILSRFASRVVKPGEVIIREGQAGDGLYVVLTGEVQVSGTDDAGERVVLATLREGDVFGEISLIRDVPATATVSAVRRTAMVVLPADDFAHLVADHAEVREYLSGLTAERIERTSAARSGGAEEIGEDDLVVL